MVAERLARRTAEVFQQVVRTSPAGVDVEEIGRLEMFSGDGDLNGRVNRHALVSVESPCSKLPWRAQPDGDLVAAGRWKTNLEDPIITDNTTMTGAERRLSIQLYCVLALTCRKRALQVWSNKFARGYGFEAWRQLCRKFEPHPPVRILWNAPSPLVVDEISRAKAVGPSVEKQKSDWQSARLTSSSEQDRRCAVSGTTKPTGPGAVGQKKKVTSQRNRRSTSDGRNLGHSKGEFRSSQL